MKKIIVCIKQVPDTNEVKIDPKTNTLVRSGIPVIINPDDLGALELALQIKDKNGAAVVVLSMGPPQAAYALRQALAMGADEAILLSSKEFAGADTWATSLTLAAAIKKIGDYSLVLTGRQAIDGDTAQVGPGIAEHLNMPQASYVKKLCEFTDSSLVVERQLESSVERLQVQLPAVLTVLKEAAEARLGTMRGIWDACADNALQVWDEHMLGLAATPIGLNGSPTKVIRTFSPPPKSGRTMVSGNGAKEMVGNLLEMLQSKHII